MEQSRNRAKRELFSTTARSAMSTRELFSTTARIYLPSDQRGCYSAESPEKLKESGDVYRQKRQPSGQNKNRIKNATTATGLATQSHSLTPRTSSESTSTGDAYRQKRQPSRQNKNRGHVQNFSSINLYDSLDDVLSMSRQHTSTKNATAATGLATQFHSLPLRTSSDVLGNDDDDLYMSDVTSEFSVSSDSRPVVLGNDDDDFDEFKEELLSFTFLV